MKIKRIFTVCLALCLVCSFGFSGCTQERSTRLHVATNVWPGYEPLYLARTLGYYNDTTIRIHEMTNSSDVLKAFRNHAVDVAALTLDETLSLLQDGIDARILIVADISNGADVIIANPKMKNTSELKGKRVGVESMALGAYVLCRALDKAGLTPRDVTIVPIAANEHVQSYAAGNVDAVVTFEPNKTRLMKIGGQCIFDSSHIPNEIIDVIVVQADVIRTKSDQLKQMEVGWFKALDFLKSNPDEACQKMAKREGITSAQFSEALKGLIIPDQDENRKLLSSKLLTPARRLAEVMVQGKLLSKPVDPSRLLFQEADRR